MILYRGPSLLDGEPIVVIAPLGRSTNRKTGAMLQTYILRDDISPIAAVKSGLDATICGDCRHRGEGTGKGRSCYVNLGHGPSSVWRAYSRRRYAQASWLSDLATLGSGRRVRLGTYGDPAAVPVRVWLALTSQADGWTGYTHQWRIRPELKPLCMASVDSLSERVEATREGWRTFRVRSKSEPLAGREISCPASAEAGKLTTCDRCGLCAGTSIAAAFVAILSHGPGRNNFQAAA